MARDPRWEDDDPTQQLEIMRSRREGGPDDTAEYPPVPPPGPTGPAGTGPGSRRRRPGPGVLVGTGLLAAALIVSGLAALGVGPARELVGSGSDPAPSTGSPSPGTSSPGTSSPSASPSTAGTSAGTSAGTPAGSSAPVPDRGGPADTTGTRPQPPGATGVPKPGTHGGPPAGPRGGPAGGPGAGAGPAAPPAP